MKTFRCDKNVIKVQSLNSLLALLSSCCLAQDLWKTIEHLFFHDGVHVFAYICCILVMRQRHTLLRGPIEWNDKHEKVGKTIRTVFILWYKHENYVGINILTCHSKRCITFPILMFISLRWRQGQAPFALTRSPKTLGQAHSGRSFVASDSRASIGWLCWPQAILWASKHGCDRLCRLFRASGGSSHCGRKSFYCPRCTFYLRHEFASP